MCSCRGHLLLLSVCPPISPIQNRIYLCRPDDTADSIYHKIKEFGHVNKFAGFQWMAKYKDFNQNIHTGRYAIRPNDNVYHVYSRFSRGYQEPMNLTIGSVRTLRPIGAKHRQAAHDRLCRNREPTVRLYFPCSNGIYQHKHSPAFSYRKPIRYIGT